MLQCINDAICHGIMRTFIIIAGSKNYSHKINALQRSKQQNILKLSNAYDLKNSRINFSQNV